MKQCTTYQLENLNVLLNNVPVGKYLQRNVAGGAHLFL